jgi:mRNA interferase RelE/StbE
MPAFRVELTPSADWKFSKLAPRVREMVAATLVVLSSNPRPPGCVKLRGADDLWRIRMGHYRIVYRILDAHLLVTVGKIGDRKDVYR